MGGSEGWQIAVRREIHGEEEKRGMERKCEKRKEE